jgi:hypothetical protein
VNEKIIGIISIFTNILPAIAGMVIFYKAGFKHRLLVFFLLFGFLTDLLKWQLYDHGNIAVAKSLFYFYSLVEPAFLCWFIYKSCSHALVSKTALTLAFVLPLFWIFTHFDFTWLTWKKNTSEAIFNTVYGMVISILASYSILRLTQQNEPLLAIPDFWFLGAIFFYCFCTFFVKAFLQTSYMDQFWFIHDLFNIMTCFIYAYGFLKIETNKFPLPLL